MSTQKSDEPNITNTVALIILTPLLIKHARAVLATELTASLTLKYSVLVARYANEFTTGCRIFSRSFFLVQLFSTRKQKV